VVRGHEAEDGRLSGRGEGPTEPTPPEPSAP